eukprot:1935780-Prymnesium_polylepis.1
MKLHPSKRTSFPPPPRGPTSITAPPEAPGVTTADRGLPVADATRIKTAPPFAGRPPCASELRAELPSKRQRVMTACDGATSRPRFGAAIQIAPPMPAICVPPAAELLVNTQSSSSRSTSPHAQMAPPPILSASVSGA